jgi:hypothetical protein
VDPPLGRDGAAGRDDCLPCEGAAERAHAGLGDLDRPKPPRVDLIEFQDGGK